jgi:hypothetical protein
MHHIKVSRAETTGAFNTGFDAGNLHRPAKVSKKMSPCTLGLDASAQGQTLVTCQLNVRASGGTTGV